MENYLLTIMKRASIFMVLAQAIIHFRPNPSYEKYFRFLVGIMAVVILAIPLMELTRSGMGGQYEESLKAYERKIGEALAGQPYDVPIPQELYLSEMEGEIKSKLNNYTEREGYSVKTVDMEWEEAGDTLSELRITLGKNRDDDSEKAKEDGQGNADTPERQEDDSLKTAEEAAAGKVVIDPVRITAIRAAEEDLAEVEKLRSGIAQTLAVEEEKVEVKIIE